MVKGDGAKLLNNRSNEAKVRVELFFIRVGVLQELLVVVRSILQ